MATQYSAHIYELSTMSRASMSPGVREMARPREAHDRWSPTLSYPQRIAAMLAHAPQAPKLRRAKEAAIQPLTDETKAMLISVHTLNATLD